MPPPEKQKRPTSPITDTANTIELYVSTSTYSSFMLYSYNHWIYAFLCSCVSALHKRITLNLLATSCYIHIHRASGFIYCDFSESDRVSESKGRGTQCYPRTKDTQVSRLARTYSSYKFERWESDTLERDAHPRETSKLFLSLPRHSFQDCPAVVYAPTFSLHQWRKRHSLRYESQCSRSLSSVFQIFIQSAAKLLCIPRRLMIHGVQIFGYASSDALLPTSLAGRGWQIAEGEYGFVSQGHIQNHRWIPEWIP